LVGNLRTKEACIIAYGDWGSPTLVKVRDRNYVPDVEVVHEVRDGVEICYLHDISTGWCEGINEHGIAIVNSALAVARDEAEVKIVKDKGKAPKKSKDGERILHALACDSIEEALRRVHTYKSGIKGHTLVSDGTKTYSVEQTRSHEAVVKDVSGKKKHVRTNHGLAYADAGYTEGEDYVSSVYRRDRAKEVLRKVETPEDIAPALMKKRKKDRAHPNNMVRDTGNMMTTSQMVMDIGNLTLHLYLLPGKVEWKGVRSEIKGKPKIQAKVYEYVDYDADGSPDDLKVIEK
jgi:hypothetical protein